MPDPEIPYTPKGGHRAGDGEAPVARSASHHRIAKIRRIIEMCMARREAGEVVEDSVIIAQHPDLAPELGRELQLLSLIEQAGRAAAAAGAVPHPEPHLSTRVGTHASGGGGEFEGQPAAGGGPGLSANPPRVSNRLRIEGFDLKREIHRGGQGVVYEAVQLDTGRKVAIKIKRDGFFASRLEADRFRREVEVLNRVEHPNIVSIIASGVQEGLVYYVMPFVDGLTLDRFVAERQPSIDKLLSLFQKVASAVNAAHLMGVIHRDLKPHNIMVDQRGEPHLVDFGLARLTEPLGSSTALQPGLTGTGHFVGSLPWASPEQTSGRASRVDLRTDVYSLGVLMFQMLTGKFPYEVEQDVRAAAKTISGSPVPSPSRVRPEIPPQVDTIILKCLRKDPDDRYQSAHELAADLRRHLDRPAARRPRNALERLLNERLPGRKGMFLIGLAIGLVFGGLVVGITMLMR